ncbi:MAG TPA: HepT-like ribonuclease domain-containing protein [Cyclobacteriaceae bacterium]|jgi:uncharacterized protein with HEPN domain|nr:HepT-like ribonuclease domain-containing protein [Cyclobacteriaceae bacterium]
MTEKEKKFLSDIAYSIELIENFTNGINSFEQYSKDIKTKGAVERHLGIIGEALNKFLKESTTNDVKNAVQIISLRNRLIHSYDSVDDSIIWSILIRHLRPLKEEINNKLK